jgi:hypothetical protein
MGTSNSRQLIVEGMDDRHSVIGLMRAHIDWPKPIENVPVYIDLGNSAEEILKEGYLTAKIKTRTTEMLGVMLDADTKPTSRYSSIRRLCVELFPKLPANLPTDGLVVENDDGKRLGVWVMPDNAALGCLETFLRTLVPDESEPIWKHATESVAKAKTIGAKCRDSHHAKANLYTWLSWQDPPGQSPGLALTRQILDPLAPNAATFVKWFRKLYKL